VRRIGRDVVEHVLHLPAKAEDGNEFHKRSNVVLELNYSKVVVGVHQEPIRKRVSLVHVNIGSDDPNDEF
jgi:hypothetical protein